ncbi:MAG: hypothetical protein QW666_00855 [Candidatus Woesearchaeota archaeon]
MKALTFDKKAFSEMRKEMEVFDAAREQLIKDSRDILKLAKGAIYSVHRHDLKEAERQLEEAKAAIKKMNLLLKKDESLASVGAYSEALEEYVEASCYFNLAKNKKLLSAKDLGVCTHTYLPGLCDLVGELVRKAVNSSIKGDFDTALEIKDFVADIYEELMMFDFRNIPARKKFDTIKYSLEKLENLVLELKLKQKIK